MQEYFKFIENEITNNKVVLFMKGDKIFPMCGFSASVCQILDTLNIEYKDVNILEDEGLRSAIKEFTDWPTIPQLYIGGKFVGGSDIVKHLYSSGELQKLLEL